MIQGLPKVMKEVRGRIKEKGMTQHPSSLLWEGTCNANNMLDF